MLRGVSQATTGTNLSVSTMVVSNSLTSINFTGQTIQGQTGDSLTVLCGTPTIASGPTQLRLIGADSIAANFDAGPIDIQAGDVFAPNTGFGGDVIIHSGDGNGATYVAGTLQLSAGTGSNGAEHGSVQLCTQSGNAVPLTISGTGPIQLAAAFQLATPAGAQQTASQLWAGTGVPPNGNGQDGDYYFRSDGGVATHIYFKSSGTWAGLI